MSKLRETYASYVDANEDVVLQSFKSKQDEMETKCSYNTTITS